MRKYKEVIAVTIIVLVVALSLGSRAVVQSSGDSKTNIQSVGPVHYTFSKTYEARDIKIASVADEPNDVFSFVPQDLNTNATVLFLNNTTDAPALVILLVFNTNRAAPFVYTIELPPFFIAPFCTDDVISSVGIWSWAVWLRDGFGSTVEFALLELPPGVAADGYVAWNGSDNKYDPGDHNDNVVTVPLRFNYVGSGHLGGQ